MYELQLSDGDLRELALLGYLGDQLANGHTPEGDEMPYPELRAALQKIYALAAEAELPDLRISQDSKGVYSCLQHDSPGLNREAAQVRDLIDDYETHVAFDIVADELAERDSHAYGHSAAGAAASDEQRKRYDEQAYARYTSEFNRHGFERLVIDRLRRPLPCERSDSTDDK